MRSVQETIGAIPRVNVLELEAPIYTGEPGKGVFLAVEDMSRHTADAGWQLTRGLGHAGYTLAGYNLGVNETHVPTILDRVNPSVIVLQDKREWDIARGHFGERRAKFQNVDVLRDRFDLFKVTVLKDAQQQPIYHKNSAEEIGCHAWIVYYHPRIVKHVAPYVRTDHLIRTYHSIDKSKIPVYNLDRRGAILSGAVSGAYPLRKRLIQECGQLPETTYRKHPGYGNRGCVTPNYLKTLSQFKVAICTSSRYGYALRKIIEATACGCIVVTDLPSDDVLPGIDGNLVRIHPSIGIKELKDILWRLFIGYEPERQRHYGVIAQRRYDWRTVGWDLKNKIESMRRGYNR